MSCKLKFGVTFHANMSIEDMALLWCKRVTPEVKAMYPEIDQAMELAKNTMEGMRLARAAMKRAKLLLEEASKVTVLASASLTQTAGPLITQYAAEELTKAEQLLVADALNAVSLQVSAYLACPEEEDRPTTMNKLIYETEIDKEIAELDTLLNTNLCSTITSFTP